MHEPVEPIFNLVGLLVGVRVHEPFLVQVFTPVEFVETTADKLTTWVGDNEEIFHVTVVDGAAVAELAPMKPTETPTRSNALTDRRKREKASE